MGTPAQDGYPRRAGSPPGVPLRASALCDTANPVGWVDVSAHRATKPPRLTGRRSRAGFAPRCCRVGGVHLVTVGRRRWKYGDRDPDQGYGVTRPPTQELGPCLGVSGRGSRRIEYPTTLVRGCSRDQHSLMSRVFLTHGAAQAVHALRSGRPRAQKSWVKASRLVCEGVPIDCNHAALKQRTTYRLRGTEDER
jgi:hypothetical protein